MTAAQDAENITESCTTSRSHDAYGVGILWKCTLTIRFEQTLLFEFLFQVFKSLLEHTNTIQLDGTDNQLVLPTRHVNRYITAQDKPATLLKLMTMLNTFTSKQNTGELCVTILEREITMARTL